MGGGKWCSQLVRYINTSQPAAASPAELVPLRLRRLRGVPGRLGILLGLLQLPPQLLLRHHCPLLPLGLGLLLLQPLRHLGSGGPLVRGRLGKPGPLHVLAGGAWWQLVLTMMRITPSSTWASPKAVPARMFRRWGERATNVERWQSDFPRPDGGRAWGGAVEVSVWAG